MPSTKLLQVIGIDLAVAIDIQLVLVANELLSDLVSATLEVEGVVVGLPCLLGSLSEFLLVLNVTWNPGWNLVLWLLLLLSIGSIGGGQVVCIWLQVDLWTFIALDRKSTRLNSSHRT